MVCFSIFLDVAIWICLKVGDGLHFKILLLGKMLVNHRVSGIVRQTNHSGFFRGLFNGVMGIDCIAHGHLQYWHFVIGMHESNFIMTYGIPACSNAPSCAGRVRVQAVMISRSLVSGITSVIWIKTKLKANRQAIHVIHFPSWGPLGPFPIYIDI